MPSRLDPQGLDTHNPAMISIASDAAPLRPAVTEGRLRKRPVRGCNRTSLFAWIPLWGAVLLTGGCSTVRSDLDTATALYREARYEQVERWARALAREKHAMPASDRLRFEYLAGISAYRLGRSPAALHHLTLAAVLLRQVPEGGLEPGDRVLLVRTMEELIQGTRL